MILTYKNKILNGDSMNKADVYVGDRVQTIKGRGIVIWVYDADATVVVELDGDHGTYLFGKNGVWKLVEDNNDK